MTVAGVILNVCPPLLLFFMVLSAWLLWKERNRSAFKDKQILDLHRTIQRSAQVIDDLAFSHQEALRSTSEIHGERERTLITAIELLEEERSNLTRVTGVMERGHAAVVAAMEQRYVDSERSNATVVKGLEEKIRALQESHAAMTQALVTTHAEKENLLSSSVAKLEARQKEDAERIVHLGLIVTKKDAFMSQVFQNAKLVHNEVVHKFGDMIFDLEEASFLKVHYQKKSWTLEEENAAREEKEKRVAGLRDLLSKLHGLFNEAG
jgi:hypothetical protein